MSTQKGTSRLLVKVAAAIDEIGAQRVEEQLDNILISRTNTANKYSPVDARADSIIKAVARELSISTIEIKSGNGEMGRLGLNLCYYFFRHSEKMRWKLTRIAEYFGKRNHNSIRTGLKVIVSLDPNNKYDKEKCAILATLQEVVNNKILKDA